MTDTQRLTQIRGQILERNNALAAINATIATEKQSYADKKWELEHIPARPGSPTYVAMVETKDLAANRVLVAETLAADVQVEIDSLQLVLGELIESMDAESVAAMSADERAVYLAAQTAAALAATELAEADAAEQLAAAQLLTAQQEAAKTTAEAKAGKGKKGQNALIAGGIALAIIVVIILVLRMGKPK